MINNDVENKILSVKKTLLKTAYECGKSVHLGGSLSIIDILVVLYLEVLRYDKHNLSDFNRDQFILSKGHCAIALYVTLAECGIIDEEILKTFMANDSLLIAHTVKNSQIGIESSNGSLGQGISMAVGVAQASKILQRNNKIYVLVGNGEINEGIVWEAAMLASQLKLDNLVVIVDNNHMQSDGNSENVLNMLDLRKKWESFGFAVREIDGHDIAQIRDAFEYREEGKPIAIIADTIKGHGISFMENKPEWHHNRLSERLYRQALEELEGTA